ncbi:MAG: methionyl-tRNA formyltransferase [Peptococcaceae bacterium]|nr:methionyl-tRNA formyltransferase [Peptococcaceae bacterium]
MKLIYMGTPEFSVTVLKALMEKGHEIAMVFTQPDRPKGRGKKLQASPVAIFAKEEGLALYQPQTLRDESLVTLIKDSGAEAVIVAAYGRIIPDEMLTLPRYGFINVHASLLPKYRGAAPIQWALRNGDAETGVSIMRIESGLDEGAVYAQQAVEILPCWNKADLFDALAEVGSDLLVDVLDGIDGLSPEPQNNAAATYAPMFGKHDGCIDFSMAAKDLVNLQRSLSPDDSIYTFINNQRLSFKDVEVSDMINDNKLPGTILALSKKCITIACGDGALDVREIHPAGKKSMPIHAFLNGHPLKVGDRFGEN